MWVRQYLAQHDPDVDAIYRLTRELPLNFDTDGGGASLEEGTFVPYNAQATIHLQEVGELPTFCNGF